MKSIFAAIGAALRAALRMLGALARLPGRLVGAFLGLPAEDDMVPPPAPIDLDDEPAADRHEIYGNASSAVMGWCAESLIDDRPAPLPPGLPIEVSWWVPGLSREECETLINVDRDRISLHLQGIREIAGVRPVGPLVPEPWPASPRTEPADAVVATCEPGGPDEHASLSAPRGGR